MALLQSIENCQEPKAGIEYLLADVFFDQMVLNLTKNVPVH